MRIVFLFFLFGVMLVGCYTFRGTSIPPDIFTFYVETFENQTTNSAQLIEQTFAEALRDKVRTESRLTYNDTDPDIEFRGTITDYRVTSEAPQPGELTAFNRLTIVVRVEYISNKKEEDNWQSTFSYFRDFPSTTNVIEVQDVLIEEINQQLVEDIFNKAFTNW